MKAKESEVSRLTQGIAGKERRIEELGRQIEDLKNSQNRGQEEKVNELLDRMEQQTEDIKRISR